MALAHEAQGDYAAALQLEREVVEIRIRTLGSKHSKTGKAWTIIDRVQHAKQSRGQSPQLKGAEDRSTAVSMGSWLICDLKLAF